MLTVVVNFHRITGRASSCVNIKDLERIKTINACDSVIIWSSRPAIWCSRIFQKISGGVICCSRVCLKSTLLLNVASYIFIISSCLVWSRHTSSCINVELVWTTDTNDAVVKWFLCWAHFVWFGCLVQIENLNSLFNNSGQIAIVCDPPCALEDR